MPTTNETNPCSFCFSCISTPAKEADPMSPSQQYSQKQPPIGHGDIEFEMEHKPQRKKSDGSFDSIDLSDDSPSDVHQRQPGSVPVVELDERTAGSYEVVLEDLRRQKHNQQGGGGDTKSPIPVAQLSPERARRKPFGDITNSGSKDYSQKREHERNLAEQRRRKEAETLAQHAAAEKARRARDLAEQEAARAQDAEERVRQAIEARRVKKDAEMARHDAEEKERKEAADRARQEQEEQEETNQDRLNYGADDSSSEDSDSDNSNQSGDEDGDDQFLDASMDYIDPPADKGGRNDTSAPAVAPVPPPAPTTASITATIETETAIGIGPGTSGDASALRDLASLDAVKFDDGKDPNFLPSTASIGFDPKWHDADHACEWVRCPDLGLTTLFECEPAAGSASKSPTTGRVSIGSGVDVTDINQGALGDCWLLSSISCLAEFPEAVESLFVTKTFQPSGRYVVRLYCTGRQRWEHVVVDDYVPVFKKHLDSRRVSACRPAFAHPRSSHELWVVLLEKAFAKCFGSYQNMSGGYNWFAFQMLTGCDTAFYAWDEETDMWQEDFTQYVKNREYSIPRQDTAVSSTIYNSPDGELAQDDMFALLKAGDEKGWLVAAGTPGKDEMTEGDGPQANKGMVDGHAYSVIEVREVGGFKLLRIRNPWGSFEWDGDWSDGDDMWRNHEEVTRVLNPTFDDNDGAFWMAWGDFTKRFTGINVCRRGEAIDVDKRASHAEKCLHCHGPVLAVEGKFSGTYYNIGPKDKHPEGKVHEECYGQYRQATAPKCLECGGPVMKIEGRYSGSFYTIKPGDCGSVSGQGVKGKVHQECWDGYGSWEKGSSKHMHIE